MSNNPENNDQSGAEAKPLAGSGAASAGKRSWVMRHKLLTLAGLFLLAALAHYFVTRPVDNPQPQKKLVVQGSFPYDKGLELRVEATYYSESVNCRQTARAFFIFPQAEVAREAWRTVPVLREGGNRYRFEFYEDAVLPGFCDWRLQFVFYRIYKEDKKVQGGAILGFPGRFNVILYGCSNVEMPNGDRSLVACYEGDDHWKDSTRNDNQIDFVWEESK